MNDDMAAELIEVLRQIKDELECQTKIISKGFHILRNEIREITEDGEDM